MWFFVKKRDLEKEIEKIKDSFKKRDCDIQEIKKEIVSKKEIELMIKEAVLNLKEVQFGVKSEPKSEPKQKINQFKDTIYQKAKKLRPEVIKQTIRGLLDKGLKTNDVFKEIVINKTLCGKTQFYHYLSLVRSELIRTEPRTEENKF